MEPSTTLLHPNRLETKSTQTTTADFILDFRSFGTKVVLLIALGGHALSWHSFLDVALLYAMVNFDGTIAIMRLFELSSVTDESSDSKEAS